MKSLLLTPEEQNLLGSIISHCLIGNDDTVMSIYDKLKALNGGESYPLPNLDADKSNPGYLYLVSPSVGKVVSYNIPRASAAEVSKRIKKIIEEFQGVVIDAS